MLHQNAASTGAVAGTDGSAWRRSSRRAGCTIRRNWSLLQGESRDSNRPSASCVYPAWPQ